ncbi:MAG: transposase [Planctomycetota bacterium]
MRRGHARIAGTPSEKVVSYLARYANRVAIANDRLIKIEGGEMHFSYKDYRDDNRWETSGGTG